MTNNIIDALLQKTVKINLKYLRHKYVLFSKKFPLLYDVSRKLSRFIEQDELYLFLKFFEQEKQTLNFLQIGANDGMRNDPLREFIVFGSRWKGCLVEPIPSLFAQLQKNYSRIANQNRIKFENIAISNDEKNIDLWKISEKYENYFPDYVKGMISFDKAYFSGNTLIPNFEDKWITNETVACKSINTLLQSFKEPIDLILLDVEGMELDILSSFLFTQELPTCFIYESCHHSKSDSEKLKLIFASNKYIIGDFGTESIAISEVFFESLCSKSSGSNHLDRIVEKFLR
ncbi:MAG: FkbM family methyltransferase [Xenococcus sp. MO_188.B8]|nr:FkbM family methyltransferase [Xenococcus sp. MO_188.B8]